MIKYLEKLLNILYIQPCYFCGSTKDDSIICRRCHDKIHFMPPAVYKEISGVKVYACTLYDGVIKTMVHDLKYHNRKKFALLQAKIMYEYFEQLNLNKNFVIIPVPIHKNRLKERKYNQMDLTGGELARLAKLNINKNLLIRIKDTEKQYNLNRSDRIKNLKNAFAVNQNTDKNTELLIIDDITSSGITLKEIIQTLQKEGYNNITALVLATPDIWN